MARPWSAAPGRWFLSTALVGALLLAGCGGGGTDSTSGTAPAPPSGSGGTTPVPPVASTGNLSLLAGSLGGAGNLNGQGAEARFNDPRSIAIDAAGTLYVADRLNNTIRTVKRDGTVQTLAGSGTAGYADGPAARAEFCSPTGVAADSQGNVFVVDASTVRKIDPSGNVATVAGVGKPLAVGSRCQGTSNSAGISAPVAVATDDAGNAYIVNSNTATVLKLTAAGTLSTLVSPQDFSNVIPSFQYPAGITVDNNENLYVIDGGGNIARITPQGNITSISNGPAASKRPGAIAADSTGTIYVTDLQDQVVRKISSSGVVSAVAGVVGQRGNTDGQTGVAQFDQPQGIAVAADGTLFVSTGADTVRSIDPSGVVKTLAGMAASSTAAFSAVRDSAGNFIALVQSAGNPAQFDLQRISVDGQSRTVIATGFEGPSGIAIAKDDNVFVADTPALPPGAFCPGCSRSSLIYRITPTGERTLLAGSKDAVPGGGEVDGTGAAAILRNVMSLTVDGADNVYVVQDDRLLRKIDPAGVVSTLAIPLPPPRLVQAEITVGADNNLFLGACFYPYTAGSQYDPTPPGRGFAVLKIDTQSKTASILAGSTTETGFTDGAGADARFGFDPERFGCPQGLALDDAGNVFVADTANNVVRKITPAGMVSTVAGQRGSAGNQVGALPASLWRPTGVNADSDGNLLIVTPTAALSAVFSH